MIAVDDNLLKLGSGFDTGGSSTAVELERDTIKFAGSHNLADGDEVFYHAADAYLGGLTEGAKYGVRVIDSQTIKLIDVNNPPAEAKPFTGAEVADDTDTITITGHGFITGQPVTYRAPDANEFNSKAADVVGGSAEDSFAAADNNNNIYLGEDHGLQAGGEVIYTARKDGEQSTRVIGGLANNGRYFVILDPDKPNEIQLAATYEQAVGSDNGTPENPDDDIPITPISLTPTKAADDRHVVHALRKVSDQPIGSLTDGVTYYVVRLSDNEFQLAATRDAALAGSPVIALDPTDPIGHAALTGTHHIGSEGIDLTSTGNGSHELTIDITAASTGTHLLEGVGGARAMASAPSGDGTVTAAASGGSGGVVRVSGADTSVSSSPSVTTTVGGMLSAGQDIVIEATSIGTVSASSANSGGGVVSVGAADASVSVNTAGRVYVLGEASLEAERDVTIVSSTRQDARVLADTNGGGLVDFADSEATATLDYTSLVDVAAGASVSAGENLLVESRSGLYADAKAEADAKGLGADADSESQISIGNSPAVTRT